MKAEKQRGKERKGEKEDEKRSARQDVLEKKKKKPVGCGWNEKKKVQWQEIKGVRDEIKRKWEKMMKGNVKWFRCMCACGKPQLSIFYLVFTSCFTACLVYNSCN